MQPGIPGILPFGADVSVKLFFSRKADSCLEIRGAYDKFLDFFRMGTFIGSTHMKL